MGNKIPEKNLERIASWIAVFDEDKAEELRNLKGLDFLVDNVLDRVVQICGNDCLTFLADFLWTSGLKEETIQICENAGDYSRALDYCKDGKMPERAVQICKNLIKKSEQSHFYEWARSYAEQAGISLEPEMIDKAIKCFEKEGDNGRHITYRWGGDFALKVGRKNDAIRFYEKGLWFEDAIKIALELGIKEKAEEVAHKSIKWHEENDFEIWAAANHAYMAGLKTEAIRLYDKANFYQKAIEIALELGLNQKAEQIAFRGISDYSQIRSFGNAADLALVIGRKDLYERLREEYDRERKRIFFS